MENLKYLKCETPALIINCACVKRSQEWVHLPQWYHLVLSCCGVRISTSSCVICKYRVVIFRSRKTRWRLITQQRQYVYFFIKSISGKKLFVGIWFSSWNMDCFIIRWILCENGLLNWCTFFFYKKCSWLTDELLCLEWIFFVRSVFDVFYEKRWKWCTYFKIWWNI